MFTTIRFTPQPVWYYPKSIRLGAQAKEKNYVDHTVIAISPEASRIGGPVVDLPADICYPPDMFFVAQLNLAEFAKVDPQKLLPVTGFLYFFIGQHGDTGRVLYADVPADGLVRTIKEHRGWFWDGCLIEQIYQEQEDYRSRYEENDWTAEDWLDDEELAGQTIEIETGPEWDSFAGSEKSKIYGIYTHCQKSEEEIKQITESDDVLLLQVGEDFTGEGIWSVLINQQDLANRNFNHCRFEWGQS